MQMKSGTNIPTISQRSNRLISATPRNTYKIQMHKMGAYDGSKH